MGGNLKQKVDNSNTIFRLDQAEGRLTQVQGPILAAGIQAILAQILAQVISVILEILRMEVTHLQTITTMHLTQQAHMDMPILSLAILPPTKVIL